MQQLILATKLGAAIGPTVDIARSAGAVDGSTFNTGEKAVMSLAPAFLKYDLDRALHRMRLECMDFALLHNPESALDDPKTVAYSFFPFFVLFHLVLNSYIVPVYSGSRSLLHAVGDGV